MSSFKLCESGHNGICNIEFSPQTFDFSKTDYYIEFTFSGPVNGVATMDVYRYRVTPLSGTSPALRYGGNDLSGVGSTAYLSQAGQNIIAHVGGRLGNNINLSIGTVRLISHTGPGNIAMSDGQLGFSGTFYGEAPIDCRIVIDSDIPIFASGYQENANPPIIQIGQSWEFNNLSDDTYIQEIYDKTYTHVNLAANYESLADTIQTNNEYFIYSQVKKNGVTTQYKGFKFAILNDAKISIAHVNDNWILHITDMPYKYMDLSNGGYSSISWTESNALLSDHVAYPYDEDYTSGGDNYTVWLYTNIPRFDSQQKQQQYEAGVIGIDSAEDGGGSNKLSPIGKDITSQDIETSTFDSSVSGSTIYLMTSAQMADLKSYLFNPNHKTDLQDGLWMWGNTPASVIIGLYYVPFDVKDFYTTDSAGVKFGSHVATDLGLYTVGTVGGKRITLFQESFEGKYGDFRDYEYMKYELYLPFVGRFIELDANKYLNKIIKCEMLFDAYKHEIRYYLFANGILQDRVDCVCGVEMPLISTDNISKAKTDIATRFDDVNNIAQGVEGALMGKMGISSVVSSVSGLIQNKMTRKTKPAETIQGGFSSSLNTFDIRYPYLRITEDLTVKPSKLNSVYNYPSYYIGPASKLSGYCEIDDIQLVSSATDVEISEIKQLLKEGVIF